MYLIYWKEQYEEKVLFLSILCLLFVTLSYTYSSFKNTIIANITANIKD